MADDGTLTTTGTLTFDPDNDNMMYYTNDDMHAYFGWWLNKPTDERDTHTVQAFAGGTTGYEAGAPAQSVEGSATYTGTAAGKYVSKTVSGGTTADADTGHFTADAELTADFGSDTENGTIDGEVSGFVLTGNGETNAANWTVILDDAALSPGTATFNGVTNMNFGGLTASGTGQWFGSFYNNADNDAATPPDTVTGIFDANDPGGTVNIIGGFGANRVMDDDS